jgi:hypothetical protein
MLHITENRPLRALDTEQKSSPKAVGEVKLTVLGASSSLRASPPADVSVLALRDHGMRGDGCLCLKQEAFQLRELSAEVQQLVEKLEKFQRAVAAKVASQ